MVTEITAESWAGKPYREIREIAGEAGSIAVVPVGSVEQHGHHMPVATDTILVDAMAREGAERVAEDVPILVTPPVWTGNSPHHMPFGGTISIGVHGLLDVLENVADSVLDNGFDAVFFLNGHGGNISTIGDAVSTVGDAHPEAEILGLTYFQLAGEFVREIRESEPGGMGHAGEFETSLMLHLQPDLVDEEAMEGTYREQIYEKGGTDLIEGGPLSVYRTFDEYSESGAIGDPRLATAEKGERLFDRLGEEVADVLVEIHEENA
jgi:creatinine amidohydrolase